MVIGFQTGERCTPRSGFRVAVAALCLVLLALLAFAQATHLHTNQADADHCQLCIVMHSTAPATSAPTAIVLVAVGAPVPQVEPIVVARQRFSRLFIRPPPVSR